MDSRELLVDNFERIAELYAGLADGLGESDLSARPEGSAGRGNSIGWLLWHVARVQDDHLAGCAGTDQVWPQWRERFAFGDAIGPDDHGFGHSDEQVDAVRVVDAGLLAGYHRDVHALTLDYLARVDADALDEIVDPDRTPPVSAGVRLVSVIGDCLQHLGQVAYLRGLR